MISLRDAQFNYSTHDRETGRRIVRVQRMLCPLLSRRGDPTIVLARGRKNPQTFSYAGEDKHRSRTDARCSDTETRMNLCLDGSLRLLMNG